MKRIVMFGATTVIAAGLTAFPSAAQSQGGVEEKSLLVQENFTGTEVSDPNFTSINACLTAATELIGVDEFDSCSDQNIGPVPTSGKQPGYLQLTDGGTYDSGGVVYNKAIPATDGIQVNFAQYQYGGTGADGIAFFLVDGDTNLTGVGAWGGSLGYAQFDDTPGVDGGYLGLGLDAWGNFSADTEGRGAGCPDGESAPAHLNTEFNRAPDNVALRGPGDGTEGYCLLATTGTDEVIGTVSNGDLYGSSFGEQLNVDTLKEAKRNVKLTVSGDAKPKVTVEIDFHDGKGYQEVLSTTMPIAAPDTYKFGFASSTGGATDVHLLRHLKVQSLK